MNLEESQNTNQSININPIPNQIKKTIKKLLYLLQRLIAFLFFPFVWFGKEIKRFQIFLSIKSGRKISEEEKYFLCSWPIFLSLFGGILGLILGIIGAIINTEGFLERLETVLRQFEWLKVLITIFQVVLGGIIEISIRILFSINDLLINNLILTPNIFVLYTFGSFLFLVICLIILLIFESSLFKIITDLLKNVFLAIASFIFRFIKFFPNKLWYIFIYKIGMFTMGGARINKYNSKSYKRILTATFFFSFIVFFGGILIFFGIPELVSFSDVFDSISYLILILFIAGGIAGFPVTYVYMRFLFAFSQERYYLDSTN